LISSKNDVMSPPAASFPTRPLTQLLGSNGPVHALTYSSSPSTYILAGSADRSIRLYNPFPSSNSQYASQLIQTYSAHGYAVLAIDVSASNATFASAGGDRSVFLWDVSTAKTIRRLGSNTSAGHTSRINCVRFGGPEESVLVSGGFDTTVRIWDLKSMNAKPIQVFEEARDSISDLLVRGHEIVVGSVDGRIRSYDLRMGKCTVDVIGAPVTSLCGMRDGKAVLVSTLDDAVRLMDLGDGGSGSCLKSYKGHRNSELRIKSCFGGNERWVVSGSEDKDGEVLVWDVMTGTIMERIMVKSNSSEVKKSADGKKRKDVISAIAWKDAGRGDQWCCAGTDGIVTVFGSTP